MTKEGPHWHFSSLPISFHHINEVISCGIAAQSDVGVVDLVLCQNALNCFSIKLALCTLMREKEEDGHDVEQKDAEYRRLFLYILNTCSDA